MSAAYMLAFELGREERQLEKNALRPYERSLRSFITEKQSSAGWLRTYFAMRRSGVRSPRLHHAKTPTEPAFSAPQGDRCRTSLELVLFARSPGLTQGRR